MKRVLITGATNGLGYHLADYYAKKDYHVTVLDIDIKDSTSNISYVYFNLAKFQESTLQCFKDPFDVVICNAGISVSGNFTDIPHEKERDVFEVNLFGHMQLIKYLLKHNLINEGGRIAFITSASVYLPFPIALAYSASKSAMDGFAHALEAYIVEKKISVTRVYPGPMDTGHGQYYPGHAEGGRKPQKSVPAIVSGIEKRKRRVYPDPLSKMYRIAAYVMPKTLCKIVFKTYKE